MEVKASVKYFSRKFHKKFQGCYKNHSMNLIAATRAEGGLVYIPIVEYINFSDNAMHTLVDILVLFKSYCSGGDDISCLYSLI